VLLQYDFDESLGYWVCMTAHVMQKALNEELAPHGITFRQMQVLGWLALEGPLSQADLAERMHLEPPTLVSVLGRMERAGWVRRAADPTDKRKRLVHPAPRCKPVWEQGVACARRVRARAARGIPAADLRRLKTLLSRVRANLEAAEPSRKAI
jgi:MarR family transcriptional regulator for hemolysin